ncbi:MAG: Plug domain-containing protein, partial [Arcobacter sp.]
MKTNYLRNKTFNLVATTTILLANNVTTLQADETNIAIDQINIEDSSYSDYESREDLKLSSTKNLYRVEKTAQFGTEVITQEEIKAQNPKDIFDLLNKTAGLDVTYQGRKHPYFVNMRGGGNITYILDGAILTG